MTTEWIPEPGELYYLAGKPTKQEREERGADGEVTYRTKTTVDGSFPNTIFKMVAYDSRVLIGDIVYGRTYGDTRLMVQRSTFKAEPVGPEVKKALNLE